MPPMQIRLMKHVAGIFNDNIDDCINDYDHIVKQDNRINLSRRTCVVREFFRPMRTLLHAMPSGIFIRKTLRCVPCTGLYSW